MANLKIDSLYSYEAAVEKFRDSKDFDNEVREECGNMLAGLTSTYEVALKRMNSDIDMDVVLQFFAEEAKATEERRIKEVADLEKELGGPESPAPLVRSKHEAWTSQSAEVHRSPAAPPPPPGQV